MSSDTKQFNIKTERSTNDDLTPGQSVFTGCGPGPGRFPLDNGWAASPEPTSHPRVFLFAFYAQLVEPAVPELIQILSPLCPQTGPKETHDTRQRATQPITRTSGVIFMDADPTGPCLRGRPRLLPAAVSP